MSLHGVRAGGIRDGESREKEVHANQRGRKGVREQSPLAVNICIERK